MPTLGDKVYKLRKSKGLTLEKLAEAIGASKSAMWELENRPATRPSAERIEKLAAVLGVTTTYLLDESQENPSPAVEDEAFYRRYQQLEPDTKKKLQEILEVLNSKS